MRRILPLLTLLSALVLCISCGGGGVTSTPNATNANATVTGANGNNANRVSDGTGPSGTGIGGTSESRSDTPVKNNTNVEPTGINRNAGSSNARTNSNRP